MKELDSKVNLDTNHLVFFLLIIPKIGRYL